MSSVVILTSKAPSGNIRERGVALAIVVWFLAAMSLLVSGIVFQARVDTRMAQLHVSKAQASALGDGAIQLTMARLVSGKFGDAAMGGTLVDQVVLGGQDIAVSLVPVTGLIDLRLAPKKLLVQLFSLPGDAGGDSAEFLADSVIKWRKQSAKGEILGNGKRARLSALEDLLRIEGITRTHLDRIADVVYVGKGGSSSTDWSVAPDALLQMAAATNPEAAAAMSGRENQEQPKANNKRRQKRSGRSALSGSNTYRVDAIINRGGQRWVRRRFVAMSSGTVSKLPWRYFRTEPVKVLAGQSSTGVEGA